MQLTAFNIFIIGWVLSALGLLLILLLSRRRHPIDEGDVYSAVEGGEVHRSDS